MTGHDAARAMAERLIAQLHRLGVADTGPSAGDAAAALDRSDAVTLAPPGAISPNGSCRLVRAMDGWLAVNLPRDDDLDLVPAWTGCAFGEPPWQAIDAAARVAPAGAMTSRAVDLGLAVTRLGEVPAGPAAIVHQREGARSAAPHAPRRVLDLSSLWAGPLCAALLAAAGHVVVKAESRTRRDPTPLSAPALDHRLNSAKRRVAIDFTSAGLASLAREADVIVSSARPRAFAALGLTPESFLDRTPGGVWIAITAHGWTGAGAERIGFGDDAAVAGGLVDWIGNTPRFAGDALADPLAGLAGAVAAVEAIVAGGSAFVDVALARAAAQAVAGT